MDKDEFMGELKKQLKSIPDEELKDILADFEEHFAIGIEEGRTEEELSESMGNPKDLAKQMKTNYLVNKAQTSTTPTNVIKVLLAFASLGLFNLIFVLGPVLMVISILIILAIIGIALSLAGTIAFIASILRPFDILESVTFIGVNQIEGLFVSGGILVAGLVILIITGFFGKYFSKFIIQYVKMNIQIIKQEIGGEHE